MIAFVFAGERSLTDANRFRLDSQPSSTSLVIGLFVVKPLFRFDTLAGDYQVVGKDGSQRVKERIAIRDSSK